MLSMANTKGELQKGASSLNAPIFIGGLANSGKTELRLMLEAHPHLSFTRRTYMWTRFYQRFGDLSHAKNLDRCLEAMMQNKHIRSLESDLERIRREFALGERSYARLFGLFHSHYAERMGKSRWGDQLGSVERFADPIFESFPNAKMIQMIRDPRDVYEEAKARSPQRSGKVGWMLANWLESMRWAKRNQSRYPQGYKVVRYERLMAQPIETLREICAFLGEMFVPEMVNAAMLNTTPKASRDSAHDMAQESYQTIIPSPPNRARRRHLSPREIAFMQQYARQELLSLGYFLEPATLSVRDRFLFTCFDWPVNQVGIFVWQMTHGRGM
jgi:hypothetical protein